MVKEPRPGAAARSVAIPGENSHGASQAGTAGWLDNRGNSMRHSANDGRGPDDQAPELPGRGRNLARERAARRAVNMAHTIFPASLGSV